MRTSPEGAKRGASVGLRDCRRLLGRSGDEAIEFWLPAFSAAAGERVALTGPSGCGKSTLLNFVSGLARPDSGSVKIAGEELTALSSSRLDALRGRTIGFVHQSFNLLGAFTALENVLLGMRFGRAIAGGERKERAAALLERVGLARRLNAKPGKLSVGERQRVAIARAVANRPSLLLADEPTGSLDPATAEEVFGLMLEVCAEEGCTLLLVTHDLELADRLPRRFDCRGLVVHRPLSAGEADAA